MDGHYSILNALRRISVAVLPHDFRWACGDPARLAPLAQRVADALGPRWLHAATRLEALLRRLLDDIEPLGRQVRQQLPQGLALAAADRAPVLEGETP